jgi:hypothetical protein
MCRAVSRMREHLIVVSLVRSFAIANLIHDRRTQRV